MLEFLYSTAAVVMLIVIFGLLRAGKYADEQLARMFYDAQPGPPERVGKDVDTL